MGCGGLLGLSLETEVCLGGGGREGLDGCGGRGGGETLPGVVSLAIASPGGEGRGGGLFLTLSEGVLMGTGSCCKSLTCGNGAGYMGTYYYAFKADCSPHYRSVPFEVVLGCQWCVL